MKQTITVVIEGGAVQSVTGVPQDVEVVVIDRDIEGSENYEMVGGEPARVMVFEADEEGVGQ